MFSLFEGIKGGFEKQVKLEQETILSPEPLHVWEALAVECPTLTLDKPLEILIPV